MNWVSVDSDVKTTQSAVVKRELSWKAKLSINWSIHVPTCIYGQELWAVRKRMGSRVQAAEISFLRKVSWLKLKDRVRSSD